MLEVKCETQIANKVIALQVDSYGRIWFCDNLRVYKQINGVFVAQKKINITTSISGISCMGIFNNDMWIITGNRKILFFNIGL